MLVCSVPRAVRVLRAESKWKVKREKQKRKNEDADSTRLAQGNNNIGRVELILRRGFPDSSNENFLPKLRSFKAKALTGLRAWRNSSPVGSRVGKAEEEEEAAGKKRERWVREECRGSKFGSRYTDLRVPRCVGSSFSMAPRVSAYYPRTFTIRLFNDAIDHKGEAGVSVSRKLGQSQNYQAGPSFDS